MTLSTPREHTKEESETSCRFARYLWAIPFATAALSWLIAASVETQLACNCIVTELVSVVVGALIGVSISNALKAHFCHGAKDRRH